MGSLLIHNVVLWDAYDDEPCPGEVLVEGARIAVVMGARRIDRDRARRQLDGRGMTLMPGLVNGH